MSADDRKKLNRKSVRELTDFGIVRDIADYIVGVANRGDNILISGETDSGKTSFLNAILQKINSKKKVISIENTKELVFSNMELSEQFYTRGDGNNSNCSYSNIVGHVITVNPDIFIVGDINIDNAYPSVSLLSEERRGFLSTIHACSSVDAINVAFPCNVRFSGHDSVNVAGLLSKTINLVIHLESINNLKVVSEIYYPRFGGEDGMIIFSKNKARADDVVKAKALRELDYNSTHREIIQ